MTGSELHGEDQDRRARVVQAEPADEGELTERAGPHGEVDDDDVGLLHAIHAESVGKALGLDDRADAGIFEQLSAALQHNWMVVEMRAWH